MTDWRYHKTLGRVEVLRPSRGDSTIAAVRRKVGSDWFGSNIPYSELMATRPVQIAEGCSRGEYKTTDELNALGIGASVRRNRELDLASENTWWFLGYLSNPNSVVELYQDPKVTPEEAQHRGLKQGRGPTRHIIFRNPKRANLDIDLKLFFDLFFHAKGISVNSRTWYAFLVENGSVRQITPPSQFTYVFASGYKAGERE